MKGRIKTYNEDRGFGFIRCFDDNEDYFFHISEVLSEEDPVRGRICEFDTGINRKGFTGVNIKLIQRKKDAQFIILDDVRISLEDIKNYGISYEDEEVKNPQYKSSSLSSKVLMSSDSDSLKVLGTCVAFGELLAKNRGVSRTLNVRRELDRYFGTI